MVIKKHSKAFFGLIILVLFDQFLKYLVQSNKRFYICNHGIAWGIVIPKNILIVFFVILIFFLFYLFLRYRNLIKSWELELTKLKTSTLISIVLVFSGAVSNIIDRIYHGCVIDFIDLKFWPASNAIGVAIAGWPVFNLADIYITIGMILLLKIFYFKK